jgi:acyl-CoA hydrolase
MADILRRAGAHLDEWVAPEIADELGFLRAGKILEWMDVVGVLAATRHCQKPVVTASVDGLELTDPVRVGERITMTAEVGYTSAKSMGVAVSMTRHARAPGGPSPTLQGYMTFVALDEQGKSAGVPQLQPETPEEIARFREGNVRREFRSKLASGQLPRPSSAANDDATPDYRLFIRESLKLLPISFRLPWDRPDPTRPRTRQRSYVHKIEPIRSSKLNFHGTLYGGTLMRWIETNAHLSARAYLDGAPVRFAGLHGLTFIRPVTQHVFVHIRSMVVHAATESLTVIVNVHAEDPIGGGQEETLRAFLTYAPVSASSSAPPRIPPVECQSDEERALFEEVEHRLALQRSLARADVG